MTKADFYLNKDIENILMHGIKDENPRPKYKDGTPAHTFFVNHNIRSYNLNASKEFPICTLRPIAWKTAIKEILWIYQDQSNDLQLLNKKYNVHYWDEWESKDKPGTIGQRYGATVKRYNLIDDLINGIINDPYGRRKIMNLWQEDDLNETDGLAPCAFCTIWNVRNNFLDMMLIQRSGDMMAASGGGGVNEVQYAALQMMIAKSTNKKPGIFTHIIANEHIYDRHLSQAEELQSRYYCVSSSMPRLILDTNKTNFYDFTIDDFKMLNYHPIEPQLKFELGI